MNDYSRRLTSYSVGLLLSLCMTAAAYAFVNGGLLHGVVLATAIIGLALAQALVQLLFFLHLRDEREPRWRLLVFDLMLLIVAILVFGTLWIMNNLDYHMTEKQGSDQYIIQDEGISSHGR